MEITALPLDRMTIEEKLMTMEVLWNDLCRNEAQIPVQEWHKQVLDERQQQFDSGDARFVDWEEAKTRIRSRIS